MPKNILIIGNGFDIYHKLPTRYRHFMFFATQWESFYCEYVNADKTRTGSKQISVPLMPNGDLTHEALKEFGRHPYLFNPEHIDFLNKNLPANKWIQCFNEMNHEELQWIDFEAEIQNVLEDTEEYSMESIPKNVGKLGSDGLPERLERIPRIFGEKADNYINFGVVEVLEHYADKRELKKNKQQLIKHMVKELDKLILCLNYYLEDFVGSIQCDWCSEQVMEIGQVFLLNFNYTTTFQTVYEEHNIIEHHAVHGGVADKNIILGISDDSFPETHDYIRFQKYFQRIQKRTGANYLNWTTTEDDDVGGYKNPHVYIFGHSLGLPDFTILNHFFKNRNIEKITIFYHDPAAYEEYVINLVKALGKDETVNRIAKEEIEFIELRDPIPCPKG